MIAWNGRNLNNPMTGVQRYTSEIVSRLPRDQLLGIAPSDAWSSGLRGHMWEQISLPSQLGGRLLWSPANTGPLATEKQVLSVMDMSPLDNPERLSSNFAAWYGFLLPKLLRRVRAVLTISEFSRDRILHHIPEIADRIRVTPLAADPRFKRADAARVDMVRRKFGIPTPHYLIGLGSLEPRKNLPRLIEAWRIAQQQLPDDISLVIAGGAGKSIVFGNHDVGELPRKTILTGRVDDDDLPALYSGAIASIYVSLYEGFGLPPLESMSCGTPVIASNAGAIPEVVGDSAIQVDPLDPESIADGVIRMIGDTAMHQNLCELALKRATLFNWDETARLTWAGMQEASWS
ncbi:glycosyltransferase family 4 protein [Sphingopyxis sp.]|uniref:glycosyltransferase family 4 protein n=1 Tax=Sphingopyxis sp. TaxID=1908224 RepID=UPI003D09AB97